jgi:hypothetical protein
MPNCSFCAARRHLVLQLPEPQCRMAYGEVIALLQAGQKCEARRHAALIRCDHMRSEALKLVERSRPLCPELLPAPPSPSPRE